jgi:hypothetical protein
MGQCKRIHCTILSLSLAEKAVRSFHVLVRVTLWSKIEQHTSETHVNTVVVNIPSANPLMNLPAKNN